MPELISTAVCFPVADVGATIGWYKSVLGFNGAGFPESEPYGFGIVWLGGVEIMFQRLDGYQKPELYPRRKGGVWDAYIRMKDVTEFFNQVKDVVEVKRGLTRQPYGQTEFEVLDPNGYVLVFSEANPSP